MEVLLLIRANKTLRDLTDHVTFDPKHRDILGSVSYSFPGWCFVCQTCQKMWEFSLYEIEEDPLLRTGTPEGLVAELLKLTRLIPTKLDYQTSWGLLQASFLDDE